MRLLHRPSRVSVRPPPSASDRLAGGIERACAFNTRIARRPGRARSRHKGGTVERRTCCRPRRIGGGGGGGGVAGHRGEDHPVYARSFAASNASLRICLATAAHRATIRAGLGWELTANQTRRGPVRSFHSASSPSTSNWLKIDTDLLPIC